jgi:hypothetical protein
VEPLILPLTDTPSCPEQKMCQIIDRVLGDSHVLSEPELSQWDPSVRIILCERAWKQYESEANRAPGWQRAYYKVDPKPCGRWEIGQEIVTERWCSKCGAEEKPEAVWQMGNRSGDRDGEVVLEMWRRRETRISPGMECSTSWEDQLENGRMVRLVEAKLERPLGNAPGSERRGNSAFASGLALLKSARSA